MRVRCLKQVLENDKFTDLTVGNTYRVLGIEAGWFRIISDEGLPFLFPEQLFEIVDSAEDADWVTEYGENGERYSYPRELNAVGFFEDFFDNKPEAVSAFRKYAARLFRGAVDENS